MEATAKKWSESLLAKDDGIQDPAPGEFFELMQGGKSEFRPENPHSFRSMINRALSNVAIQNTDTWAIEAEPQPFAVADSLEEPFAGVNTETDIRSLLQPIDIVEPTVSTKSLSAPSHYMRKGVQPKKPSFLEGVRAARSLREQAKYVLKDNKPDSAVDKLDDPFGDVIPVPKTRRAKNVSGDRFLDSYLENNKDQKVA